MLALSRAPVTGTNCVSHSTGTIWNCEMYFTQHALEHADHLLLSSSLFSNQESPFCSLCTRIKSRLFMPFLTTTKVRPLTVPCSSLNLTLSYFTVTRIVFLKEIYIGHFLFKNLQQLNLVFQQMRPFTHWFQSTRQTIPLPQPPLPTFLPG